MSSKTDALRPPLQFQLDEITAHTRALVPPERLARAEQLIRDLEATGLADNLLAAGEQAPAFTLPGANGRKVYSADLLALGPLVIKFFRGRWDPYDVTELEVWETLQPELRARKALFVAISPQTVRQNAFMVDQHRFSFPLLSDAGCLTASAFRLAYIVPEHAQAYFRSLLVNIPFLNGDTSWRLPLPATLIVNRSNLITFSQAFADHRTRPEPETVISMLS